MKDGRFFWDKKKYFFIAGLLLIEVFLFFSLVPFEDVVYAQNTSETVSSRLTVNNVYPDVFNVSIDRDAASLDLSAGGTKIVECLAVIRDYDGEDDIINVSAEFFDQSASSYGGADDNNNHYNRTSELCTINYSYGDSYYALANCTFNVWYYANNATWNCYINVADNYSHHGYGNDTITINRLLALDMPNSINYGVVNATAISEENISRLYNYGNVGFNLSLYGYARIPGDNLSMNCSLGTIKNISIGYEKYNLTASNQGDLVNLTIFETNYTNLTSSSITRMVNLPQRLDDANNEAYNDTYWRIYVPLGVAGSCSGNIVFVATQSQGT